MQQTAQKEIEKEYISKTEFYLNSRINDLQFLISEMREDIKNLENKFDKKIDETNKRIDDTNKRIDGLFVLLITAIITAGLGVIGVIVNIIISFLK